jgi:hypothetical protein
MPHTALCRIGHAGREMMQLVLPAEAACARRPQVLSHGAANFRNVEFLLRITGIIMHGVPQPRKNISQHALRQAAAA